MEVFITHIDTACVLLEINGYRILTDPTLDNAGHLYHHGFGALSRKTGDPAITVNELGHIDLVLLSHHQHKDNFDHNGKKFTETVPLVISTKQAAKAIKGIIGLDSWESFTINTRKVPGLTITATPAQHHPAWVPQWLAGKVTGFVIEFDEQPNGVIYISGDTVYFKGIEEIANCYTIDVGIFNMGSVQFRYLTGFGQYTFDGRGLVKAVQVLQPNKVIPVHYKGWSHFKENESTLRNILNADPQTNGKTVFLVPGRSYTLK